MSADEPPFAADDDPAADEPLLLAVGIDEAGQRLDAFLARSLPKYSRVQLRRVIGAGGVLVNGLGTKVARRLSAGDQVTVVLPPLLPLLSPLLESSPPPHAERTSAALTARAAKAALRLEWNFMGFLPCAYAPACGAWCGVTRR